MKFSVLFLSFLVSANALAYDRSEGRVHYYCTLGNPFTQGLSKQFSVQVRSNDVIDGNFSGKEFSFVDARPRREENNILVWQDSKSNLTVKIQMPGPYDGLQDTQWGEISKGSIRKNLNCYPNE